MEVRYINDTCTQFIGSIKPKEYDMVRKFPFGTRIMTENMVILQNLATLQ